MSKKKNSSAKAVTQKKGRPTPKRNVGSKAAKNQQNRSAKYQWYIIAAVLAIILITFIVVASIYSDPAPTIDRFENIR